MARRFLSKYMITATIIALAIIVLEIAWLWKEQREGRPE
jgi:hypothetical protein